MGICVCFGLYTVTGKVLTYFPWEILLQIGQDLSRSLCTVHVLFFWYQTRRLVHSMIEVVDDDLEMALSMTRSPFTRTLGWWGQCCIRAFITDLLSSWIYICTCFWWMIFTLWLSQAPTLGITFDTLSDQNIKPTWSHKWNLINDMSRNSYLIELTSPPSHLWPGLCLLLSTLVCCQPSDLIFGFFCFKNFPVLPPPPPSAQAQYHSVPVIRDSEAICCSNVPPCRLGYWWACWRSTHLFYLVHIHLIAFWFQSTTSVFIMLLDSQENPNIIYYDFGVMVCGNIQIRCWCLQLIMLFCSLQDLLYFYCAIFWILLLYPQSDKQIKMTFNNRSKHWWKADPLRWLKQWSSSLLPSSLEWQSWSMPG